MNAFSGAMETFYAEANELLAVMEDELISFDNSTDQREALNSVFRAAHTIKGSSGIFGLNHIVEFTHVVENLLDKARDGELEVDQQLISLLLKCRDHIEILVQTEGDEFKSNDELIKQGELLHHSLHQYIVDDTVVETSSGETKHNPDNKQTIKKGLWYISIRLDQDCLRNGMDPISFIRFLSTLGSIHKIETIGDNLPEFNDYDPESLYLVYQLSLEAEVSQETIEDTFMFVEESSDIQIVPPESDISEYLKIIQSAPENESMIGQLLISCGAISEDELFDALSHQSDVIKKGGDELKLGEILTEKKAISSCVVEDALNKQKEIRKKSNIKEPNFIRVDSERLDVLINLIGELVINSQRIELISESLKDSSLNEAVESLENFTEEIRDAALDLRMVPIGATFQRFKRVVRDTAEALGKNIDLVIEGAEAELDRLMVEKLVDPLTHIVRNAIDHGVESSEERLEKSKSKKGTVKLSAYHESGHIVIEVSDDGKGLDAEKLIKKAINKGILNESDSISPQEINQLIFHPGFSTAENVTDLSGRGVGMDVVKRNVEALQGSIEIESVPNKGSTFRMRLPLTLAIIDGFYVESEDTNFIIPQATIVECMDFNQYRAIDNRHCINLRGDMIPFIRLKEIFKLQKKIETDEEILLGEKREKLVIVQFGDNMAGILVDELNGEIQTVVKPMGQIFQMLKGIGGSTLLGNGDIAFILDIPQLIEVASDRESKQHREREKSSER
ncbi:chemotaxis protein CheA [Aliikangiella sp. IMCC44359]|uniref:chemotaxis protein CheA n=1 Tax=Aliikangiella sp. IMCC44359 TaxID=3459125 RepID=UPI00403AC16B